MPEAEGADGMPSEVCAAGDGPAPAGKDAGNAGVSCAGRTGTLSWGAGLGESGLGGLIQWAVP